jgi:hypothetical protein
VHVTVLRFASVPALKRFLESSEPRRRITTLMTALVQAEDEVRPSPARRKRRDMDMVPRLLVNSQVLFEVSKDVIQDVFGDFRRRVSISTGTPGKTFDATLDPPTIRTYCSVSAVPHPTGRAPERWKMTAVIIVGIFVVAYPATYDYIGPKYFESLGLVPCVLMVVGIAVVVNFYVLIPVFVGITAKWVYSPWRESRNPVLRALQKGLPCFE